MGLKETSKPHSNTKLLLQKLTPKLILVFISLTFIFLISTLLFLSYPYQYQWQLLLKLSNTQTLTNRDATVAEEEEDQYAATTSENDRCDIFTGEWVPNPKAPYYTNTTCWAIHEHQNCIKYGRPDSDFMKWRWKPQACELPLFNPAQFLELLRGKSLAFVGDSVARNHMQSLICLLSRVQYPVDESRTSDENFKRWKYAEYNFTMAAFWTPHLVRTKAADVDGPTHTGLFNLYLDEFDTTWTTQIDEFDYIILSGGHWFYRPSIYYENNKIVGCNFCQLHNITDVTKYYGFRKAFRTALKAINSRKNYQGITYLRTFAPSHFEGGIWNKGGNCVRTKPFKSNTTLVVNSDENQELYLIQIEELRKAEADGRKKFRLLDTTQAMLLRPDGHPSRYGHWPNDNVTLYNDCVHWCLPGPIDSWSDFLLHMLKMEGRRSRQEQHQGAHRMHAPVS